MLKLEKRQNPSRFWLYATPVAAVVLTIVAGFILFAFLLEPDASKLVTDPDAGWFETLKGRILADYGRPAAVIRTIFWDPLFGPFAGYTRGQLLVKAGPLILIAVGLALGFRAGIWNIGAEGQYIMGALVGASVALAFYPSGPVEVSWLWGAIAFTWDMTLPRWILFPLAVLAGAFGGWVWAMIPAVLKTRFNTNEILVSLMLVYVAQTFLAKAATGFLRNPESAGFPGSRNFSGFAEAANPFWIAGSGLHWGGAAALGLAVLAYILLTRHLLGFQIRLAGQAPRAARFHGVSPARLVLLCMGISGVLAGLAGWFEVSGPARQISINFNTGYGFTAIIVAFLGRLNPLGIVLAGFLMALTYVGGEMAATNLNLPSAAIQVFQGMLLFFLLGVDVMTNYRFRFVPGAMAKGAR
ncbi:ABC transporter permease [Pseudogemmobacter sonorensis]|uniref:ABC transporter permease n=1 Tax=Pseudogemmobacter sonorensis TaxID=2989681 RepID=UPI0036982311